MIEKAALSVEAMKSFQSYVRCATLPDAEKMKAELADIEQQWPAYANDKTLCLLPKPFWDMHRKQEVAHLWNGADAATCNKDGAAWRSMYLERKQHAFSRMNHHIHPLPEGSEERRVLQSCKAKGTTANVCKHGAPWTAEMCEKPILVCRCIAQEKELPHRGQRSTLGSVLPARNWDYLNAGPTALVTVSGDNADVKFTQKIPITASTHEADVCEERKTACVTSRSNRDMLLVCILR